MIWSVATIRRRKTASGQRRYYAEVRIKGQPPVRQTFHTKAAAAKWSREVEDGLRSGRLAPRLEGEKHTVAEAIDRYLEEHLADLGSKNGRHDRRRQLVWWRQRIGALSLASLSPAAISDARRELLKSVSGPTSNRYLAALSAVMRLASQEWLWVGDNPVSSVRRKREHRGRVRFLSEEERDRLLIACEASPNRLLYPLTLFALTTGARKSELLGLRWRDVDLANRRAVLEKTKNRDRRMLSFPGRAGEILAEMSKVPSITGYVFAGERGRPNFPRKAWESAIREAELENFRWHDLRHTAASYLAMSGATLPEIAAFLGHRTFDMVRRYSHLSEQHSEAVAARMAEKFLA